VGVGLETGGENMVTVTDQAAQELCNILSDKATKPNQALRLVVSSGGGFGLGLDEEREGDRVLRAGEQTVLLVAPAVMETVGEATIATQETEEGPKLVISRY
jgi:Fe-S cluster assembly iron-binding protein IscA